MGPEPLDGITERLLDRSLRKAQLFHRLLRAEVHSLLRHPDAGERDPRRLPGNPRPRFRRERCEKRDSIGDPNPRRRLARESRQDLEDLLGQKVDVVTEKALHGYLRDRVLRQATAL